MTFSRDLKKFSEKTKRNIRDVWHGALYDVGSMIIVQSPVDTGRFRLNWNFKIGEVDTSTTEKTASKIEAINESTGKLLGALGNLEIGEVFYMSNNLPYAIPLEYGHSEQAPTGMVRTSVRQYKRFVSERVKAAK